MRVIIAGILLSYITAIGIGHAKETELSIDQYYSSYTGANAIISGLNAYEILDDMLLPNTIDNTSTAMSFARIGKWSLEYILFNIGMITQHEVFGHGYRAREFDLKPISYKIRLFSGKTTIYSNGISGLHPQKQAAITAGGIEATGVLAKKLEINMISDGVIDRRDATLYLVNALDQVTYAFGTRSNDMRADNDFYSYINNVNAWQGPSVLKRGALREKISWDLFDPFLYYSFYSIFHYLWTGDPDVSLDTLHIGSARFMPSTRTLLSPWGPELELRAHLFTPENRYIGVSIRNGRTGGVNSYGTNLELNPWLSFNKLKIASRLSLWKQPHLFKYTAARYNHDKFGGAIFLDASYQFNKLLSAVAGLGYKTSGYLPGTPLDNSSLWKVGVGFSL